jgi:hypothetical protein
LTEWTVIYRLSRNFLRYQRSIAKLESDMTLASPLHPMVVLEDRKKIDYDDLTAFSFVAADYGRLCVDRKIGSRCCGGMVTKITLAKIKDGKVILARWQNHMQ